MRDNFIGSGPILQLEHVTASDGSTRLLDDVSLAITAGAPTALIGPNGSGKTTLLRLIMGLIEPTTGVITQSGMPRAIVFQKPVMLRRSVADNIAFAITAAGRRASRAEIYVLLGQVGLTDIAERSARKLSGGERQRLGIARALARQPELLLLDEATASLDPPQCSIMEELMRAISLSGVKIIFSTHDLGHARRCAGDVIMLDRGRVVEHATASSFFSKPTSEAARRYLSGELLL